jgi:hypothetical protein
MSVLEGKQDRVRSALSGNFGVIVFAAAAGAAVPAYLLIVGRLGHWIPHTEIYRDYLLGVVWAMVLGAVILLWPVTRRERILLAGLWAVRCSVTLGAMLAYEGMYSFLDAYSYFDDAAAGRVGLSDVGFGRGTQLITLLSGLQIAVINSYHALKVSYSYMGLLAVFLLYRAGGLLLGRTSERLLLTLGLFPSLLFWSSIIGKEPPILLGMALYAYGVIGWLRRRKGGYMLIAALGIVLAMSIRTWNGPILVAPLMVLLIGGVRGAWTKIMLFAASGLVLVLSVRYLLGQFGVQVALDLLEAIDNYSQAWAVGGSAQQIDLDFTSFGSVMAFIPRGAFTALFRPLPGEVMNPFGLVAGIENLALLLLAGFAVVRTRWRDLTEPVVLWAVMLVFVWASLYGFLSYQNLGTAVRFKLQILPVLLGLLLYQALPALRREARTLHGIQS